MPKSKTSLLETVGNRMAFRRWARAARHAPKAALPLLRQQRTEARKLRQTLNDLLFTADSRLALPLIGSQAFTHPVTADWGWRPQLWRGPLPQPGIASVENQARLGDEVSLFHDCGSSEIILRQLRNRNEADLAPFGLRLEVFRFTGSYLSLSIDLPPEAGNGLERRHLIRLNTIVELEQPLEIFARLNIKHGPNTEQIVRELPLHEPEVMVEFDLAYSKLNEKRIERLWVDLIFEGPAFNQVVLRDMTMSRRPRAEL